MKMRKSFAPKDRFHTREAPAVVGKDKDGSALLLCPFCPTPHTISTNSTSACGTILQVRALQTLYKAKRNDPKAICIKCQKGGGEMAIFQGALVHIHDCTPGVVAFSTPPEYSKFAKFAHGLKEGWLKHTIQKYFGTIVTVEEVTPEGVKTGTIYGHFFNKAGKNGRSNRQSQPTATES